MIILITDALLCVAARGCCHVEEGKTVKSEREVTVGITARPIGPPVGCNLQQPAAADGRRAESGSCGKRLVEW